MHEGHKLLHDSTYESAIAPLLLDWMEENPSPLFGPTFYRAAAQHIGKCIEDAINHGTTHVSCRLVPDESVLKTAAPPSPADMAQIVQYAMKSAAVVEGSRGNVKWAGTCFRVTERHFVTCAHVVNIENRPPFDMTTVLNIKDNNEVIIKAWPVLINYDIDAAVIEIDTSKLTNFGPPLKMGNSKEIYPGQKIITVGAPEGVEGVASIGYVASEYYKIPDLDSDIFFINLEIHPGSSGGPILDENGLVIGIARGAYGRGEAHDMGLNYCIPINYIKEWLDKRLFRVR
jgi:S1-C subfamily serine protease